MHSRNGLMDLIQKRLGQYSYDRKYFKSKADRIRLSTVQVISHMATSAG